MDLALSVGLYVGLVAMLVGVVLAHRGSPARARLARRIRWAGAVALAPALAIPGCESAVGAPQTALDAASPRWQYHERHHVWVNAPTDVVRDAVRATTAAEITGFQTLTAIRRLGRPGPENILHAPSHLPLLDVATRTTFVSLVDTPSEIVIGTLVAGAWPTPRPATLADFAALDEIPGLTKAAMHFDVAPEGRGTRVKTETRVFATDRARLHAFGWYWRAIYPGSALIRLAWLQAIKQRAERPRPP